jgi:hypothetical protein
MTQARTFPCGEELRLWHSSARRPPDREDPARRRPSPTRGIESWSRQALMPLPRRAIRRLSPRSYFIPFGFSIILNSVLAAEGAVRGLPASIRDAAAGLSLGHRKVPPAASASPPRGLGTSHQLFALFSPSSCRTAAQMTSYENSSSVSMIRRMSITASRTPESNNPRGFLLSSAGLSLPWPFSPATQPKGRKGCYWTPSACSRVSFRPSDVPDGPLDERLDSVADSRPEGRLLIEP